MKYLLQRSVLTAALLFAMAGSAGAQTRIATVDMTKLFDDYYKTKEAKAAINDRLTDLDKEDKDLKDSLKKATEDYQKLRDAAADQAVSTEERDKRKKVAEDKLKDLKERQDTITQFEAQARSTLEAQRLRMRDNLLGDIRAMVAARAKVAGYQLVVDSKAETPASTPVFVFASGENDLTANVLEQLNAAAPAETVRKPAAEKKDEKTADKKEKK